MLLRIFLYIKKNDLGVFFYSKNIEYYRMISPQKKPKFFCEKCNFSSNNKKDWSRHVGTAKHLKLNDLNPKKPLLPKIYICTNCNKEFNANNSLWYHKKVAKEVKRRAKRVKEELSDVADAVKEVGKQTKDVVSAAKGKKRKGRKPKSSGSGSGRGRGKK